MTDHSTFTLTGPQIAHLARYYPNGADLAVRGEFTHVQNPDGTRGCLVGSELDGARFEAQLAFPGQIKQVLDNWRGGARQSIGDRDFLVVQGSGPRGLLASLYFDPSTGLLSRLVRYGPSPVGRMPTQVDYSDYRDVGGIKLPFQYKFTWLDGRYTAKLNEIKTNIAVDATKFARPTAP